MRILIVICCLLVHVSYAQTYNQIISDSLYRKFLEDITFVKRAKYNFNTKFSNSSILRWDTLVFSNQLTDIVESDAIGHILLKNPFDTLFTPKDMEYFKSQILAQKDSVWHIALKTTQFINKPSNEVSYNSYALPLFSTNKQLALIKRRYVCSASYPCLQIVYDVYRRVNDKWHFFAHVSYLTD